MIRHCVYLPFVHIIVIFNQAAVSFKRVLPLDGANRRGLHLCLLDTQTMQVVLWVLTAVNLAKHSWTRQYQREMECETSLQQEDKNIFGKLNYKLERGRRMIMYCKYSQDGCLQYECVHVRHFGAIAVRWRKRWEQIIRCLFMSMSGCSQTFLPTSGS